MLTWSEMKTHLKRNKTQQYHNCTVKKKHEQSTQWHQNKNSKATVLCRWPLSVDLRASLPISIKKNLKETQSWKQIFFSLNLKVLWIPFSMFSKAHYLQHAQDTSFNSLPALNLTKNLNLQLAAHKDDLFFYMTRKR